MRLVSFSCVAISLISWFDPQVLILLAVFFMQCKLLFFVLFFDFIWWWWEHFPAVYPMCFVFDPRRTSACYHLINLCSTVEKNTDVQYVIVIFWAVPQFTEWLMIACTCMTLGVGQVCGDICTGTDWVDQEYTEADFSCCSWFVD